MKALQCELRLYLQRRVVLWDQDRVFKSCSTRLLCALCEACMLKCHVEACGRVLYLENCKGSGNARPHMCEGYAGSAHC